MSLAIPLIRAGALAPMLRWMSEHGRPVEPLLSDVGLTYAMFIDPMEAVPVRDVARLLENSAEAEGPNIGCRFISDSELLELALVGKALLGARSPLEAFMRASRIMPWHSSHEVLTVKARGSLIELSERWLIRFDDLTLHMIHQYVTAIVMRVCAMTGAPDPLLRRIEMTPHPELGVTYLEKWFSLPPVSCGNRVLRIEVDRAVAERSFTRIGRDRGIEERLKDAETLVGDGTLSSSARHVIALQLIVGKPSLDRLARSAGLTRRTLQRRLAKEGSSFSKLVESERKLMALESLSANEMTVSKISQTLGYSHQSTLTRAVRRWIDRTPVDLRFGKGGGVLSP